MLDLDGTANDVAAGLEAMAIDYDAGIRPRAVAASRLLELTGVDPDCANAFNVPELPADPLPEPCRRMKAQYRVLLEWSRRGYVKQPILWKGGRVRWVERSCVEAVVLSQLLHRGLRGDALVEVMRRVRKMPAVTLAALASEPDGVDKLYDRGEPSPEPDDASVEMQRLADLPENVMRRRIEADRHQTRVRTG